MVQVGLTLSKRWLERTSSMLHHLQPWVCCHVTNSCNSFHSQSHSCLVYSPRQSGVYAAVLFAGGLYSYMPIAAYGDILSSIASHGFVVVGVELLQFPNESVPLLQRSRKPISNMEDPQKFFQELDWVGCAKVNVYD